MAHATIWLCEECTLAHRNGESPDDGNRAEEVDSGQRRLAAAGHISDDSGRDGDSGGHLELTSAPCDCCRTRLAGDRYRFAHWLTPVPPAGCAVGCYLATGGPRVTIAASTGDLTLTPGDAEALARALLHAAAKAGRL